MTREEHGELIDKGYSDDLIEAISTHQAKHKLDIYRILAARDKQHEEKLNEVYEERNLLVLLLAKILKTSTGYKVGADKVDSRWPVVYLEIPDPSFNINKAGETVKPARQVSWHIPEYLFDQYGQFLVDNQSIKWDGHTTKEKYSRIKDYLKDKPVVVNKKASTKKKIR